MAFPFYFGLIVAWESTSPRYSISSAPLHNTHSRTEFFRFYRRPHLDRLWFLSQAIIRDTLDRSWTRDIYRYDVNPADFIASNGPRFSFLNKNHTFPFGKPEEEEEKEEEWGAEGERETFFGARFYRASFRRLGQNWNIYGHPAFVFAV